MNPWSDALGVIGNWVEWIMRGGWPTWLAPWGILRWYQVTPPLIFIGFFLAQRRVSCRMYLQSIWIQARIIEYWFFFQSIEVPFIFSDFHLFNALHCSVCLTCFSIPDTVLLICQPLDYALVSSLIYQMSAPTMYFWAWKVIDEF